MNEWLLHYVMEGISQFVLLERLSSALPLAAFIQSVQAPCHAHVLLAWAGCTPNYHNHDSVGSPVGRWRRRNCARFQAEASKCPHTSACGGGRARAGTLFSHARMVLVIVRPCYHSTSSSRGRCASTCVVLLHRCNITIAIWTSSLRIGCVRAP